MDTANIAGLARPAILLALAAFALAIAGGFLGLYHPAFDSFSHFRLHLAAALIVAALAAGLMGHRAAAAVGVVIAVAAVASARPAIPGVEPVNAAFAPKDQARATYRLLHMNLRFNNAAPDKVLSLVGRIQPDVITLNEVSEMWRGKLDLIRATYPYRLICPARSWVGSAAVLSRRPFKDGDAGSCNDSGSFARTTVDFGGRYVDVVAMHLMWPWPFGQAAQIDRMEPYLASIGPISLVAGDLNAVSWSHAVHRVADAGSMTMVPGPGATWLYRKLPKALRPWIGLPLDHVFAKGAIDIHSITAAKDAGSDHAPVIVEFSLAPGRREPEADEPTATASRADEDRRAG